MVVSASFACEMADCESSIFLVRLYRFDSILARLFSRSARSGWSSGVIKSASSAFETAACKSSISPIRLYRSNKIVVRLFSSSGRSG